MEALFQLVELGPHQEPISKQRTRLLNLEEIGPCSLLRGRFGTCFRLETLSLATSWSPGPVNKL